MTDITEVVRCRRLEVVDRDGVVRAALDCPDGPEDAVYFEVFTPKHADSAVLGADVGGVFGSLWHRGDTAASFALGSDGSFTAGVAEE
jgi:hypothetical protein